MIIVVLRKNEKRRFGESKQKIFFFPQGVLYREGKKLIVTQRRELLEQCFLAFDGTLI